MNQYVTGAMIKELREKYHLTQAEFAGKINVSGKTVSKWETGKGLPDITLIEPLAKALSVSVMELMSGNTVINKNLSLSRRQRRNAPKIPWQWIFVYLLQ